MHADRAERERGLWWKAMITPRGEGVLAGIAVMAAGLSHWVFHFQGVTPVDCPCPVESCLADAAGPASSDPPLQQDGHGGHIDDASSIGSRRSVARPASSIS